MSHQVATTVRSFCFGLYCSAFLSNCEKYWEFLKRNLKAKLFIKGCLKPEVPTSRLRTSTSSHFSFRELSSAVYSAKVRRRDLLGDGGAVRRGRERRGEGKRECPHPHLHFRHEHGTHSKVPGLGALGLQHRLASYPQENSV